jgi:hypothetical protein
MVLRNQNLLSFKVGAGALDLRGLCLEVLCSSQRPGPENITNPLSKVTKIRQSPSVLSTLFTHKTSARSACKELFSSSSAGEAFPFLYFCAVGTFSGRARSRDARNRSELERPFGIPFPVLLPVRHKKCRICRSFQDSPRDQSYFSEICREREESVL